MTVVFMYLLLACYAIYNKFKTHRRKKYVFLTVRSYSLAMHA